MTQRLKKYLFLASLVIALGLAVVAMGLVTIHLSFARQAIAQLAYESLGVALEIRGPLRLRLGWGPRLEATDILVTSPAGSSSPLLLVDSLDIKLHLRQLLHREVRLLNIESSGVALDYCAVWPSIPNGADDSGDSDWRLIALDRVHIDGLRLHCPEPEEQLEFIPDLLELSLSAKQDQTMQLTVTGDASALLSVTSESLNSLLDDPEQFPLQVQLQAVGAALKYDGILAAPLRSPALNGAVELTASDPVETLRALNLDSTVDLSSLGALEFNSQLKASRAEIVLALAKLSLGEISLTGAVELDLQSDCPQLSSQIQTRNASLNTLAPLLDNELTIDGQAEQIAVETLSCGETVEEHLASLHATGTITNAGLLHQGVELPVTFYSIQFDTAWQQPGSLTIESLAQGEALSGEVTFGSIAALQSGASWPLQLRVLGADAILELDGEAAFVQGQPNLEGTLGIDIARFGALHRWIGSEPENLLAAKAEVNLSLDTSGLTLSELSASIGQSDLRGEFSQFITEQASVITATLESDLLDLDEMSSLFPPLDPDADGSPKEGSPREIQLSRLEMVERWFAFPQVDFDLRIKRVQGEDQHAEKIVVRGLLKDRMIEEAGLGLIYEDIDFEGKLSANFQARPWTMAYRVEVSNMDIGRALGKLGLVEGVTASAEQLQLDVTASGLSLAQFRRNSHIRGRLESFNWIHRLNPDVAAHRLFLSSLDLTTSPSKPSRWLGSGEYDGVPVELFLQTPFIGDILDSEDDLPFQLALGSGQDVAIIDTVIHRSSRRPIDVSLSLSGQQVEEENFALPDLVSPLKGYQVQGRIAAWDGQLSLSEIHVGVGATRINGQVDIKRVDPGLQFDINLASPFMETEDFVGLLTQWRELAGSDGDSAAQTDTVDEGFLAIVNREIDKYTEQNSYNVAIDIDELRSSGVAMGDAEFKLTANSEEVILNPFRIDLNEGSFSADYAGRNVAGGIEAELNIDIERLEYGGLLRLLNGESDTNGLLYLETSLSTSAPSWAEHSSGLAGTLDIVLFPENVEADFLDLWASNLVLALLPAGGDSGKKMNCMVARFDIENGVMHSKTTLLDSTDIIVRARGSIDLNKGELDLLIAPQAKDEKFLSVSTPLKVTGPLDDFAVNVAPGGFLTTMIRWYYGLIYVPLKWLTGERFPEDGIETCYKAMEWDFPVK